MEKLTPKQRLKIKGPIIDANNRLNGIFDSFDSFNNKFSPGNKLIDLFSSYFSFYFSNRKCTEIRKTHFCKLDEIIFNTSADPKTAIVILDASIKNKVTMSIAHILSRTKSVNLVFSHFLFYFLLFSIYFCIFLFIKLRVRISHITQKERHRRF